jgi:mono/diheme cytochrome c family protein
VFSLTRVVAALFVIIAAASGFLVWLLHDAGAMQHRISSVEGDPDRGAYLARLAGCVACHTNAETGGPFLGGGGPIATVYGTFYAPNITSDVNFGIGAWTLEQFATALIAGRMPDGRHYYPVFPYTSYRTFGDQEVADLWAALRTVTPAQTKVPDHRLRISLIDRRLVGVWRKLATLGSALGVRSDPVPASDRGAYIAQGPGLCAQCHRRRNLLGGAAAAHLLEDGGPNAVLGQAPSLAATDLLRRGWTAQTLSESLRTGRGLDGAEFRAPMDRIVETSTAFLRDDDREALVRYLLDAGSASPARAR